MRTRTVICLYAVLPLALGLAGCKRYVVDPDKLAASAGAPGTVTAGATAPRLSAGAPAPRTTEAAPVSSRGGAGAPASNSAMSSAPVQKEQPAGATTTTSADGHGWTELRGPKIGSGKSSHTELRRTLNVKVIDDAGYMAMRAFALRSSPTSTYITVLVEVTNTGKELQCFVEAEQIKLKSKSGAALTTMRDSSFVSGSIAQSSVVTDTCLAGGETGYFSISPSADAPETFDSLSEIEFSLTSSDSSDFERPDFKLVPKSYTANADRIQITLVNEGKGQALIEDITLVEYVLLDAEGLPIDMGYLEASPKSPTIPTGGTLMAEDTYYFTGSSERMKVLASY